MSKASVAVTRARSMHRHANIRAMLPMYHIGKIPPISATYLQADGSVIGNEKNQYWPENALLVEL